MVVLGALACGSPSSGGGAAGAASGSLATGGAGTAQPPGAGSGGRTGSGGAAAPDPGGTGAAGRGPSVGASGGAEMPGRGSGGAPGSIGASGGDPLGGAGRAGADASSGGSAAGGRPAGFPATGGAPSSGATGGLGGGAGVGPGASGGAAVVCGAQVGTDTRPQLSLAEATAFTAQRYLAQSDNWNPTAGLGQASAFTPNFTVAADGSGTHRTIQAAVDAAATGTARRYILVKPGTYRGAVVVTGSTPLTLYGANPDATQVVIVEGQSATSAGSTGKSATFTATADDLQIMNLTISNDFATPPTGTNIQAVALYTTGDRAVLQNVRLHGFQDTLFTDTASESRPSRVYIKNGYVEGDTDFIFGGATLVIDGGTIHYLSSRKASGGGACLAPSTRPANPYGFLVVGAAFTADPTALANKVSLGRSWDEGGITPTPNGQAVVRESILGPHIRKTDPWAAAATSARPFSRTGNRFSEFCDMGPGAAP